jgi:hypothetical protein
VDPQKYSYLVHKIEVQTLGIFLLVYANIDFDYQRLFFLKIAIALSALAFFYALKKLFKTFLETNCNLRFQSLVISIAAIFISYVLASLANLKMPFGWIGISVTFILSVIIQHIPDRFPFKK